MFGLREIIKLLLCTVESLFLLLFIGWHISAEEILQRPSLLKQQQK